MELRKKGSLSIVGIPNPRANVGIPYPKSNKRKIIADVFCERPLCMGDLNNSKEKKNF